MPRALVLNATYEPLSVVSARRAVVLVVRERAEVVESNGHIYHSEHLAVSAPSVIKLRRYVKVRFDRRTPLNRRAVFLRDDHSCQYCGQPAENLDHVVPRAQGGGHTWDNVVAACRRCNTRKGGRTPDQAGVSLLRQPHAPRSGWTLATGASPDPTWERYLVG
ncbi:MAG: HNH endonuclease [Acidimicrobiia bacterium]|nr:HNH endonuclease [Acidimicrobiia bacterium]